MDFVNAEYFCTITEVVYSHAAAEREREYWKRGEVGISLQKLGKRCLLH
jgi:hypothetical protein